MKWISILSLLLLSACASQPKHTYLKYAGYLDGCIDASAEVVLSLKPEVTRRNLNYPALDAMCMELYIIKLEMENIKPPMKRVDKNEMI